MVDPVDLGPLVIASFSFIMFYQWPTLEHLTEIGLDDVECVIWQRNVK